MITTYKWNLITRIFGFENFYQKFRKNALRKGFLGLINLIKAKEILSEQKNRYYLIRFSRYAYHF
jgi:hypothetical protein